MSDEQVYCVESGGGELKKRKNRWGNPVEEPVSAETNGDPVPRRSRFDPVLPAPTFMPQAPVISQEVIQQTMIMQLQLQKVNEKLITVVRDALEIEARPDRSPSPPPKYDSSGKRTNTREVRMRDALIKEKGRLIEEMMKLNPTVQAPVDYIKSKPVRRIYLPKQTNPLYNYIGLIIGPRGNTQKQMEQDTGCKISIRGKGSAKEGSKGRQNKNIDEDDELHVHITAEDEASVEKASLMIEELLKPQDDALNEHKQKQLRELALINGTLREDEYCPVCGEKGHRQFECPHRARSFKAAGVKCSICGDLSHPTRDCPLKQDGPTSEGILDSEYDSFMAELGEGPARGGSGGGASSSKSDKTSENGAGSGGASSSAGGGGGSGGGVGVGGGTRMKSGGPIYVAPIVDLVPTRATKGPQTIIHVTTVMTGLSPPVFTSSMTAPTPSAPVSSGNGSGGLGAPAPPSVPALGSYPSYPTQPAALTSWGAYPPPAVSYASAPYPAPAAAAYPGYVQAAGGGYDYANYGYPSYGVPAAAPAAPLSYGSAVSSSYAPLPAAAPTPAAPPPPPAAAAAPAAPSTSQFHYVYPNSTTDQ